MILTAKTEDEIQSRIDEITWESREMEYERPEDTRPCDEDF